VLRSHVADQRHQVQRNPFLAGLMKVVRTALTLRPNLYLPPVPNQVWVPGPYTEIGTTDQTDFVDTTTETGVRYLYYVQAETAVGGLSNPSNVVAVPLLTPPVTQAVVMEKLHRLSLQDVGDLAVHFMRIQSALAAGDTAAAGEGLQRGADQIAAAADHATDAIALADLQVVWAKWQRRVALSRRGLVPAGRLSIV
jgi:hypothetical protein